jgi:hypothetical protein
MIGQRRSAKGRSAHRISLERGPTAATGATRVWGEMKPVPVCEPGTIRVCVWELICVRVFELGRKICRPEPNDGW